MLRTLGLVSLNICILATSSFAGTYHVGKTGNDGNSCSQAQSQSTPKLTIQAGINCATSAGDVVVVHAGTYTENGTLSKSGSVGNPIILRANVGDLVTWTCNQPTTSEYGAVFLGDVNYYRIQGFTFANCPAISTIRALHYATTDKSSPMQGIEIIGNVFSGNGNNGTPTSGEMSQIIWFQHLGYALASPPGTTVNTISGNTFTNNFGANIGLDNTSDTLVTQNTSTGSKGSQNSSNGNLFQSNLVQFGGYNQGIRNTITSNNYSNVVQISGQATEAVGIRMDVGGASSTISGNIIHDLGMDAGWNGNRHFVGIMCEAGCNDNLFSNNLVYNVNETCIAIGSNQTTLANRDNIFNNTFYNCGQVGIYLHNAKANNVENNIVSGTVLSAITVHVNSVSQGGHVFRNNLWYRAGSANFALWNVNPDTQGYGAGTLNLSGWDTASGEAGSVGSDPFFVDSSTGDFHLRSNSPAINNGATLSEVTTDLSGVIRPRGCCYDIGAYEFGGTVTSPSAPPPPSLFIPGSIEAENYYAGGQNVGYFDTTPGNLGGACKTDDVDIKDVTGEGCTIGYTEAGEWLAYGVNVTSSGAYNSSFRIGNGSLSSQIIHLEVDGQNITGPISIPSTGSYSTLVTVTGPTLNLTQGTHILKLYFDTGLVDINWMEFQAQPSSVPSAPSAVQISFP